MPDFFRRVIDSYRAKDTATVNRYEGFQQNGAVVLQDRRGTRKAEIPDADEKSFSGGSDPLAIYKPTGAKTVDAAKAMANFTGWAFAAVNAIASEVANIEWRLYQVNGDDHQEKDDHALLTLLDGVNEHILSHIAEIVNGSNTQTIAALNAPNWSFGIQLTQVVAPTVATTTGTTASSTSFAFSVAALDGTGTTTLDTPVVKATDNNGTANEGFQLSWGAVQGATGYAVYFATSSSPSATLTQYFYATSTNGVPNTSYTFATSTGSLSGSYTKADPTAYSIKLNPLGSSYVNGGNLLLGTTTAASSSQLEVNGYQRASLSATSTACYSATAGEMFYNSANSHEWGCNGTNWIKVF